MSDRKSHVRGFRDIEDSIREKGIEIAFEDSVNEMTEIMQNVTRMASYLIDAYPEKGKELNALCGKIMFVALDAMQYASNLAEPFKEKA